MLIVCAIIFLIALYAVVETYIQSRKNSKIFKDFENNVQEVMELSKRQRELSIALIENIQKRRY